MTVSISRSSRWHWWLALAPLLCFLVVAALPARGQRVWEAHERKAFHYTVRVPRRWYASGSEGGVISLTDFPPHQISTGGVRPRGGAQIFVGRVAACGQAKASGISDIEAWVRVNTRFADTAGKFTFWCTVSVVRPKTVIPKLPEGSAMERLDYMVRKIFAAGRSSTDERPPAPATREKLTKKTA